MRDRGMGYFSGVLFLSQGYRQPVTEPDSLRSQVSSALADPLQVGWQARNWPIFLGRDDGLDTAQWIISALNGLSSFAGLRHQSAPKDRMSLHG